MADQIGQTPPESSVFSLQPVDLMIDEVASLGGGSDTNKMRQRAAIYLDRAADRMNMYGSYLFRQKEKDFAQTTDFSTGDKTVDTPSDWAFPVDPALALDANGDIIQRLEWKTFDILRHSQGDSDAKGVPLILSMRNELDTAIHVFPAFDVADIETLRVNYLARIQRPSEVSSLAVTPEAREALISGGQAFMVRYRHLAKPNVWRPMFEDFKDAVMGAKAAANRWLAATHASAVPELDGQIRTIPRGPGEYFSTPPVYIPV